MFIGTEATSGTHRMKFLTTLSCPGEALPSESLTIKKWIFGGTGEDMALLAFNKRFAILRTPSSLPDMEREGDVEAWKRRKQ